MSQKIKRRDYQFTTTYSLYEGERLIATVVHTNWYTPFFGIARLLIIVLLYFKGIGEAIILPISHVPAVVGRYFRNVGTKLKTVGGKNNADNTSRS